MRQSTVSATRAALGSEVARILSSPWRALSHTLLASLLATTQVAATSDVAYPEMRAALARRHRDGPLSAAHYRAAKRAVDADWPNYLAVNAMATLCREAGEVAERYRLRGFDAIHLASFMELLRTADGVMVEFSSFDSALNRAAAAARRAGRQVGRRR